MKGFEKSANRFVTDTILSWLGLVKIRLIGISKSLIKMQADLVKVVMNETFDYIHKINVDGNETGRITDTKDHFDRFMLCANGRNGTDGFPIVGRLPNYVYR